MSPALTLDKHKDRKVIGLQIIEAGHNSAAKEVLTQLHKPGQSTTGQLAHKNGCKKNLFRLFKWEMSQAQEMKLWLM